METKMLTETWRGLERDGNLEKIAERLMKSRWLTVARFVVCYLIGVAIPFIGSELLLRIMSG